MQPQRPAATSAAPATSQQAVLARILAAIRGYGLPIALGYFPAAAAFGLLARQSGLSTAEALFLSIIVFAGASQFLLVGMVGAGVAWPGWVLTGVFMNLRHLLFAVAVAPRWRGWSKGRRAVASFALTDEVYAVAASAGPELDRFPEAVAVGATAYLSWVGGTFLGAWGSVALPPALAESLEFALPALFLALLVPALRERPGVVAALVGGGVALGATAAGQGAWGIVLGGLLGAVAGGLVATGSDDQALAASGGEVRGE